MKKRLRRAGFTLVEIALAIMVISIGMLAVFSLFPAGMASNKYAIDDTYGAMFADEVFNGLRAILSTNDWNSMNWNVVIPERSSEKWGFPQLQQVRANGGLQVAEYRPASLDGLAIDFAVRYDLVLLPYVGNERAYAILTVYAGEVGPTNNPVRAFTEFYNTRAQE